MVMFLALAKSRRDVSIRVRFLFYGTAEVVREKKSDAILSSEKIIFSPIVVVTSP